MNEFIEKLIERLEKEHERCINRYGIVGGNQPAATVKRCINVVEELAEEYKDGWIPCSERLPIGEEYRKLIDGSYYYKHMLTTTTEIDIPICVGWYDQENEVWCDLEGFAFYPIAWQPLPAPYQPKGENELYMAKSVDGVYQEYNGDWK